MTKRPPTTETRTVLRTILSAGVLAVLLVLACAGTAAGATWVVDDDGGADFVSIQAAVDAASAGDTIEVRGGTYVENVDVDKRLTLIGDGADVVTVQAADAGDHVFEVTVDWVNISWFKVTGATTWEKTGFYLNSVNHCNISENNASNNDYGIFLKGSNDNTVQDNAASNNGRIGISVCDSDSNTLQNNTMSGNKYNFDVSGYRLSHYTQNIDTSNMVDGKPIYYWVDQQDKQIPCDAGFVGVVNSTNITVKDLTLTNNVQGVLFAYTENSRIEGVIASNNDYGIRLYSSGNNTLTDNTASNNREGIGICLYSSSNNTLTNNTASNNHYHGICLYYSSNNTLTSNTANSNNYGIHLYHSSNNTLTSNTANSNNCGIYLVCCNNTLTSNTANSNNCGIYLCLSSNNTPYHNNFIDNTNYNAYDDSGTNQWDNGAEGNYFSDYTGTDSDGDGIGDTPYPIPGGSSEDRYPLMEPWSEPTPAGSVHNINKGTDYTTIQAAISDADIGDEIHVDSGTYYENVVVNKQLTLLGIDTGAGMPVVDAGGIGSAIALNVNGITLEGFKATNTGNSWGDAGINVGSSNCLIKNNELSGHEIDGIFLRDSSNNILSGNYIHETERWAGIYLDNSSGNVISNNICEDNKYRAIYLFGGSSNNEVINNICKNDDIAGIKLYGSLNCAISNNTCENTSTGIYLSYSTGNTITNNNIMENNDGVWLAAASDNRIYHNNLIANTRNAYEYNGVNQWDSGTEGNYYSDYTGTDSDGDGIGDDPHPIPGGGSVDRYPLMAPWTAAPLSGKIAFASFRDGNQEVYVMNADGNGDPIDLTNRPDADDGDPTWSPDGKQIAFSSDRGGNWKIYVMNADDGSDQVCLLEDVHNAWGPAWSPDGKKIAVACKINPSDDFEIYTVDIQSKALTHVTDNTYTDSHPSWSPDSHKIVFTSTRDGNQEIYVADLLTGTQTRLTDEPLNDDYPEWSPDGSMVVFVSERDKNPEIYSMNIASKAITRLTYSDSIDKHAQWSPDGQNIVFISDRDSGDMDVYVMKADGTGITCLVDWEGNETHPTWSSGHSPPPAYSVGEGAPDLAIKNHFIDAYNRNGGLSVLSNPATDVHAVWEGYLVQDFPGVSGIPGGVIMYNDIRGAAYYIHGAIWERYYTFVDKSELGPVASDEGEAAILPQGTTGRYTKFETGTIHWISDKDDENVGHSQRGESFVTYGELDALYTSMGGTYSDLGFPVMDQEEREGHGFCEFESGSIAWDGSQYKIVSMSLNFQKPNYPSEVFTTGDLKYSMLNTKGDGFTVKIYASVILPDKTMKYAYSDEWPSCFGISTTSLTCSLSPLLLSDVKRPLVEESIQIEDRDVVWNANEMTGDDPPGLYTWKVWYEDINNPGKILASSTASYTVSYTRPELMRLLIKEETKNEFTITVDGQEYIVATLKHYINPVTLGVSETDEVKVYLDMDGNPVADEEISRKIGVVDYVHKLQKNGLKDKLSQKQDDALLNVEYTGTLPLTDWTVDTLETLIQLPTKSVEKLIKTFLEESATFVGSTIFNNKEELNEAAIEDFLCAHNNYLQSWNEIRNDEEVLDYEKANIVLQNYLLGDFNYGMGQFILDNYYKPKGELIVFEMREAAKIASLGTTEEIIAAAISVDYVTESFKEQSLTNCDISLKPYEFTSYTLQLAQSSPVSNNYDDCITNVEESTTQIKQEVSDFFTQQITLGIIHSPGELRIYDSQNRVTGLIDGQIIEDIPNSVYVSEDETVIIYDAMDTYRYEVEGTEFGTYGLDLISFNNWDTIFEFNAFDIPITSGQNHQYNINWEMLFNGQNGVSIQIDSDGDGVFEQTIITGNTFYIYNITFVPPHHNHRPVQPHRW